MFHVVRRWLLKRYLYLFKASLRWNAIMAKCRGAFIAISHVSQTRPPATKKPWTWRNSFKQPIPHLNSLKIKTSSLNNWLFNFDTPLHSSSTTPNTLPPHPHTPPHPTGLISDHLSSVYPLLTAQTLLIGSSKQINIFFTTLIHHDVWPWLHYVLPGGSKLVQLHQQPLPYNVGRLHLCPRNPIWTFHLRQPSSCLV